MSMDELIGNLATFKIALNEGETRKKKGIALNVSSEDISDEDLGETINMLAKNFNKTLKRFNKKPFSGGSGTLVIDKNNNRWKKPGNQGNSGACQSEKSKGIQCRECEGFGHIQVECPNYLKKQSRNYSATHSNDESECNNPFRTNIIEIVY
ncbi:hypothetical protein LIER_23729 [Lithospermum erythrorhizon]|uniref:Gag-pol polyprotein n=1 Tax=Lithospermum erythrorhizon TaxID=34254 RepID=A0AAV3R2P5_LITER